MVPFSLLWVLGSLLKYPTPKRALMVAWLLGYQAIHEWDVG